MTRVDLPLPRLRTPRTPSRTRADAYPATAPLERDLRARVAGDIRFDAGYRAAYSTDASNFRLVPRGVVVPRSIDDAIEALTVCREHDVVALPRGGGTSLAGQTANAAVVIDLSRHCTRLLSVDADERSCWVEPGIVLDDLNTLLAPYGLRFGPEPATHSRCTIGGMIGNNSCGATAQHTGKTVDNTIALDVVLYDGTRLTLAATGDEEYADAVRSGGRRGDLYRRLRQIRDDYGDAVRAEYPPIPRRVSGYNLDSLLPENDFNLAQAFVGSEGTLGLVVRAKLRLMPVVREHTVVLLGYGDHGSSADDVPEVLKYEPLALEGFDSRTISYQQAKGMNPDAVALLPEGPRAWLLVQFGADTAKKARRAARAFQDAAERFPSHPTITVFEDDAHQRQLWKVREAALGATAEVPGLPPMWSGWEDSAVAPDRLGEYLRALERLLDEFGYSAASLYGHYGQGCVHTRIPFDLTSADGIAQYRSFMERAAHLVASLGGSLSGEHGDGRSRSELLPIMYSEHIIRGFDAFKAAFDPADRMNPRGPMNPGVMARPDRLDEHLRLGADYSPARLDTHFQFPDDDGDAGAAFSRCVGVGLCRRGEGGVMCPSYMVTRDEEQSTRGRSRILFEMLQGHPDSPITDGWHSSEAKEALDLCLSCKGCKKDCPVNVDMATYKSEFLSHYYEGRMRPLAHYSMGWLPALAQFATRMPRLVNALTQAPVLSSIAKALGGVATERRIPRFADETFQAWYRRRGPRGTGRRGEVVLWPDTFSNSFHPHVAEAAVEVLEAAGWRVVVPEEPVCCGLTWISTGQLDVAERVLQRTAAVLKPHLDAGTLVLGLEPSCTAVFRSDARELFPDDPTIARLREQTVTLSELLTQHTPGWKAPHLARRAVIQEHCHQHAIMGFDADLEVLRRVGVDAEVLDSGCCGLAGNFGFEKGHYEVSDACGERALFPALRATDDETIVLADGFSCRTQIEQGATDGREGVHLAELLAAALHGDPAPEGSRPELAYAERPRSSAVASVVAVAGVAGAAVTAATVLLGAIGRRGR